MSVVKVIEDYIKRNDYSGRGLDAHMKRMRLGNARIVARTMGHIEDGKEIWPSGIVKCRGQRYHFYAIKPWAMCPNGRIDVERIS